MFYELTLELHFETVNLEIVNRDYLLLSFKQYLGTDTSGDNRDHMKKMQFSGALLNLVAVILDKTE